MAQSKSIIRSIMTASIMLLPLTSTLATPTQTFTKAQCTTACTNMCNNDGGVPALSPGFNTCWDSLANCKYNATEQYKFCTAHTPWCHYNSETCIASNE